MVSSIDLVRSVTYSLMCSSLSGYSVMNDDPPGQRILNLLIVIGIIPRSFLTATVDDIVWSVVTLCLVTCCVLLSSPASYLADRQ